MKRSFTGLRRRLHERTLIRRKRVLEQAAREMMRGDQTHGGSIWRSGKGGSHPG